MVENVKMSQENKRYNPRGGAIHPEPTYTERNTVPDNSNEILRRRLLQKIEEKKRLLNLTKAMSGTPASEGGMSREKANRTVQLLNNDISNLEKELKELESGSDNHKISDNSGNSLHIGNVSEEMKHTPVNLPPKVECKYRQEYVRTASSRNSIIRDMPVVSAKKTLNWNTIASIILTVIILSLVFFVITHIDNSKSLNTHNTPANSSNNTAEKAVNPAYGLTNTSDTTGTATQSKFKHTYIDKEGNVHEVEDYTSQGGSKYDVIIKNASVSKSENVLDANKITELIKTEPSKNEISSFITNIEKQIVGWWDETKPKAEFNSATYDIESLVFNKVNEERKKKGLHALIWDSKLAEVARLHSLDMANRSYFSHENPEGEDPTMRAIRNGYNVHKELGNGWYSDGIAENIGMMPTGNVEGYGYVSSSNDVADAMMKSWMNSPGHRENILNADYNFIGVGVAYNGYGTYYLTQDFK